MKSRVIIIKVPYLFEEGKIMCVYKLSFPNNGGLYYIGCTKDLKTRTSAHINSINNRRNLDFTTKYLRNTTKIVIEVLEMVELESLLMIKERDHLILNSKNKKCLNNLRYENRHKLYKVFCIN